MIWKLRASNRTSPCRTEITLLFWHLGWSICKMLMINFILARACQWWREDLLHHRKGRKTIFFLYNLCTSFYANMYIFGVNCETKFKKFTSVDLHSTVCTNTLHLPYVQYGVVIREEKKISFAYWSYFKVFSHGLFYVMFFSFKIIVERGKKNGYFLKRSLWSTNSSLCPRTREASTVPPSWLAS